MNARAFLNTILRSVYSSMHDNVRDNYDAFRFSYDGVDRSNIFENDRHADFMALFADQYDAFYSTYLLLSDDISRARYTRLIHYRLLGHLHSRINDDYRASDDIPLFEKVSGWQAGVSTLSLDGLFGPMQHYENVTFDDKLLRVDCWPDYVVYTFLKRQYFFERSGVRIQPEPGDKVIDAGACLGDTAVAFSARVGSAGRVFSFDPLPTHVTASTHNLEQNEFGDRAAVIPVALSNMTRNAVPATHQNAGVAPGFSIIGQETQFPIITIDDFVAAEKPGRIDFIKMDIEGSELAALQGAENTLIRDRPKLAISLYHRPDDFITIPQYLSLVLPDYSFHLEHYTIHNEETVLYGLPPSR